MLPDSGAQSEPRGPRSRTLSTARGGSAQKGPSEAALKPPGEECKEGRVTPGWCCQKTPAARGWRGRGCYQTGQCFLTRPPGGPGGAVALKDTGSRHGERFSLPGSLPTVRFLPGESLGFVTVC